MKGDRHEDDRMARLFAEMRAEEKHSAPEFGLIADGEPAPLVVRPRWGRLAVVSLAAVVFAVALRPTPPEIREQIGAPQLAAVTTIDTTLEQWLAIKTYEPPTEVLIAGLDVSSLTEFQASTDALLPATTAGETTVQSY